MKTILLIALATAMLAVAAPALAQSPTQGAYSGTGANQVSSLDSTSTTTTSASTLPFTGLDLGAVSAVGIAMLGTGFLLRRRAKSDTH
jgi:hypothetical protein